MTSSSPTHIWDYCAVVMKRIPLVLLFLAASVGAAWFFTQKQQKLYRATAVLQIVPPSMLQSSPMMFMPTVVNDDMYLNTQLELLRMPEMVQRAVKDANLAAQ